ncbi:GPR1/FUN34/YaaH family transporter [Streptomyces sp. NPDC003042]
MMTGTPSPTTTVLRPYGTPLPLGFLGLAGGAFLLAGVQLDWIEGMESHVVPLILLTYAFPLQLLASLLAFRCRDSVAGTAMGVLAGTWLAAGAGIAGWPPSEDARALGMFLILAAVALLVPIVADGLERPAASAALAAAAVTFLLTGIHALTGAGGWQAASGVAALVLTALALYAAAAFALEDSRGHPVLPVGRHGRAAHAVADGTEPGIRPEL